MIGNLCPLREHGLNDVSIEFSCCVLARRWRSQRTFAEHIALPSEHVGQEPRAVDAAKEKSRGIDLSRRRRRSGEYRPWPQQQGEILVLSGPNGAGKSSLINVISGVYRPDRGHVAINGKAYRPVPTEKLASPGVARTFREPRLVQGSQCSR